MAPPNPLKRVGRAAEVEDRFSSRPIESLRHGQKQIRSRRSLADTAPKDHRRQDHPSPIGHKKIRALQGIHEFIIAVRDLGGMCVDARKVPHAIVSIRPSDEHLDRGVKRSGRNRKAANQFRNLRHGRFRAHVIHVSTGSGCLPNDDHVIFHRHAGRSP